MKVNNKPKYTVTVSSRVPQEVAEAMESFVREQRNDFPKYDPSDLIRLALVEYLKRKKYLEDKKKYL